MIFLFSWVMFGFYVNFQGGIQKIHKPPPKKAHTISPKESNQAGGGHHVSNVRLKTEPAAR